MAVPVEPRAAHADGVQAAKAVDAPILAAAANSRALLRVMKHSPKSDKPPSNRGALRIKPQGLLRLAETVDVDHRLGKGLRGFLRQIVADATG